MLPMDSFDRQPVLTGSNIVLRPLKEEDWAALYEVAADPLLWAAHPAQDRWQEPKFRAFFDDGLASGGALAMVDAATGAVIGSSRYDLGRAQEGEVEIGWTMLARDRWGGPVNGEVKRLMLAHALATFECAIFLIGEANIRSRRAVEKIGGQLSERIVEAKVAGIPVPHVVYIIDRAGFAAGPLAHGKG